MPSPDRSHSTPADCAACRGSIRQGSHSFYVASLLLPVEVREPAYAVYAFCRMADDLIDRDNGGGAAIAEMTRMLDRIYSGRPGPGFVERGFADVTSRFAIPRAIPDALLEGLAWDAGGRRYRSLDDLKAYAVRVAGTVGVMMTMVMGSRDPQVLARACDLGVAMQLTNIARDIGEDAAAGRIYMPLDWLAESGIGVDDWLHAKRSTADMRRLVETLLAEAEVLYERSMSGIAVLPAACRLGIAAARRLYREIGMEIMRGVDPVTTRAITTRRQKLRLLAEAALAGAPDTSSLAEPAIAEATFLIEATTRVTATQARPPIPAWWDVGARSVRLVHLLHAFAERSADADAGSALARRGQVSGSQ